MEHKLKNEGVGKRWSIITKLVIFFFSIIIFSYYVYTTKTLPTRDECIGLAIFMFSGASVTLGVDLSLILRTYNKSKKTEK